MKRKTPVAQALCTVTHKSETMPRKLVRLRLDDEEGCSLLRLVAVLVIDLLQEALHPRDQIGGVYRRGIAGGLEIARDLLLHWNRNGDLGRGRRHIAVLLPAARAPARARSPCRRQAATVQPSADQSSSRDLNLYRRRLSRPPQCVARPRGPKVRSRVGKWKPVLTSRNTTGARRRRLSPSPVLLSLTNWC